MCEEFDTPALERHLMEHGLGMGLEIVMSPSVYRQVSFAAPGASMREAAQALDDILDWHRQGRLLADRTSAERDLAHDMTDENSVRLLGMVREQVRGG